MEKRQRTRKQLIEYLWGTGIEIGALHKPMDLTGANVTEVLYVDSLTLEELRNHYPELNDLPLVTPDIVVDGTTLATIEGESLDFIIANHLIEHLDNPLLAFESWCGKLKQGGVVFMAVPDKRYTFDKPRPLTPLHHLIDDYESSDEERVKRNRLHFVETAEVIEGRVGKSSQDRVNNLIARNYSIHHHVWTFESFGDVLDYVIEQMQVPYEILDYSSPLPGDNEFIFILSKGTNGYREALENFPTSSGRVVSVWAFFPRVKRDLNLLKNEGLRSFIRKFLDLIIGE